MDQRLVCIIPARGGSEGLPGKNVRPFAGHPLIAHSILLARRCPDVGRIVVSTDSPEIAEIARRYGAEVPFLRPSELARADTPLWPVLQHALAELERAEETPFDQLLLLDPTSPARLPEEVGEALRRLRAAQEADGIVAVSKPDFNPLWVCVVQENGWMRDLFPDAARLQRRQEVSPVYRVNGAFYLWRTALVRTASSWRSGSRLMMFEIPEARAFSIDTMDQFERAEALVKAGLIRLPWLA